MSDPVDETDFHLQGFPEQQDEGELRSRAPVEILATQFVEELRAGQMPSVENYARRFPLHAVVIRESFPVLALLEQARQQNETAAIRRNMPETFPFKRLGTCELLCELGRGGMGVVFQARDTTSQHLVAVKVLPWRVSMVPEWQKRFEEEARTTARLRHRNIVPVYRFGQEHGYCYYVMQFVDGIGLDVIIRRLGEVDGVMYQDEIERAESTKPSGYVSTTTMTAIRTGDDVRSASDVRRKKLTKTSWSSFTQIAIQATQALRCAHGDGVLHNDIKPANLLLDGDGRVWITDFGLSETIDTASAESSMKVMGTLRYMAPERLEGNHDARSDIYSLGMTLYELLTRRPAYEAKNEEQMVSRILEQDPPHPRQLDPLIPKSLETIVRNAVARHPQDRYESAEAMLVDLLKFSRNQKVVSLRPSRLTEFMRTIGGSKTGDASASSE
ncbi:MAG: serine/threonine protein kinase [Fuerstiella sp.]|nr:serine/threonine protein kinase [Fuerstiella sp.]MCP4852895.1 serine/threonine protein kinase [Fuerstiella sp.]